MAKLVPYLAQLMAAEQGVLATAAYGKDPFSVVLCH